MHMSVKGNAIPVEVSGDFVLFELLTIVISFDIHDWTPPLQQFHASKVEAVKGLLFVMHPVVVPTALAILVPVPWVDNS